MTDNTEHLKWIHDRMVNVYGESENVDFLIRLRQIIKEGEALTKTQDIPTHELGTKIDDDYQDWGWDIN